MNCPRCNEINNENALYCSRCGGRLAPYEQTTPSVVGDGAEFNDHLVGSILATLFCCWPLGVPAIVFAAIAKSKYETGDIPGAQKAAGTADGFLWASFLLGLLTTVISIIVILIIAADF
jgi:hypothetical protein